MTAFRIRKKRLNEYELYGESPIYLPENTVPLNIELMEQVEYEQNERIITKRWVLFYLESSSEL